RDVHAVAAGGRSPHPTRVPENGEAIGIVLLIVSRLGTLEPRRCLFSSSRKGPHAGCPSRPRGKLGELLRDIPWRASAGRVFRVAETDGVPPAPLPDRRRLHRVLRTARAICHRGEGHALGVLSRPSRDAHHRGTGHATLFPTHAL